MLLEDPRKNPTVGSLPRVEAQKRLDSLTKPQGSLGKLEELARRRVAMIQRKSPAAPRAKTVIRLRSGPRDYRGRRQCLSQRGHRANDLQLSAWRRRHQRASPSLRRRSRVIDIGVDYEFSN